MSRYTGPACKLCRRERTKLFLKGERCMKVKCAIDRERPVPGASKSKPHKAKLSDYGEQLRAKQKIRRSYGITEKQFKKIFAVASKKAGITSFQLLSLLELRLDNIVYRLGFAPSRAASRQLVTHGHIRVNGRKTNIASRTLRTGDTIEIKQSDKTANMVQKNLEAAESSKLPEWLTLDKEIQKGEILRLPQEGEIQSPADEQLVVELYSK